MLETKKHDPFDALVANWIGEVGQLHRQIQKLPMEIDAALTPTKILLQSAQVNLAKQLSALPGAADKEMKRAGAQTIAELSDQVALIASRISADSAQAERHRAFYLASALLSVSAVMFAGLGVYLGSRDWSTATLCGTVMLGGIATGMILLTFLNGIEHSVDSPTRTPPEIPARHISEVQFAQAVTRLSKQTSSRTLAACKEVLVGGESCVEASHKYDVLPAQITRLANELRSKIK